MYLGHRVICSRSVAQALSIGLALAAAIVQPKAARADQEASNAPHVSAGPYGRCYAKSVPKDVYDQDDARQVGYTRVYRVEGGDDALLDTYAWYSQTLFVLCNVGPQRETALARLGPWQRGQEPRADHLAIAFYLGGRLAKSYSTLDIAGPASASGASPWPEAVSRLGLPLHRVRRPAPNGQVDLRDQRCLSGDLGRPSHDGGRSDPSLRHPDRRADIRATCARRLAARTSRPPRFSAVRCWRQPEMRWRFERWRTFGPAIRPPVRAGTPLRRRRRRRRCRRYRRVLPAGPGFWPACNRRRACLPGS